MNASWFYHDIDMRNDIKIKALRRKFGLEGYAVYNCLLEMLSAADWFQIPFGEADTELIAADLDIDSSRLSEIVKYCVKVELLTLSQKVLTCDALRRRFESLIALKERRAAAGRAGMKSRWYGNNDIADDNNAITNDENGITTDNGEDRIGEDGRGEEKKKESSKETKEKATTRRFKKPTPAEVQAYCDERNNGISGEAFCDFYESKGWMIGKSPMKDWKGAVRTWEQRRKAETPAKTTNPSLGVGEYINEQGQRTYGDGSHIVPMDAPKRLSAQDIWDSANQRWIVI